MKWQGLIDYGFNVMPLLPQSKRPLVSSWKPLQSQKYDGEFPENGNAAVICGKISGNLYVVDLDDASIYDDLSEYHDTLTVKTGKGYHLYFRCVGNPPVNIHGMMDKRGRTIDIKGESGYVVAPGSFYKPAAKEVMKYPAENREGFEYMIQLDKKPKYVSPARLMARLNQLGFNTGGTTFDEIEKGVSEGGRNDATFKYACMLVRRYDLDQTALLLELEKLNTRHSPPLPAEELEIIAAQAIHYESKPSDSGEVIDVEMRDINADIHEAVRIRFKGSIIALGERQTYIKQADYSCKGCGDIFQRGI